MVRRLMAGIILVRRHQYDHAPTGVNQANERRPSIALAALSTKRKAIDSDSPLQLGACSPSEQDAKGHRPRRARTDALTSSHGTTSSGNSSSSATRRSSSALWNTLRGNRSASAQMLAQISSTSANRSSTSSLSI